MDRSIGTMIVSIVMYLVIILAIFTGWGMNLYKLVHCDFETPYKTEIIRSIGIIPAIGMFTGWMTIGEEIKSLPETSEK